MVRAVLGLLLASHLGLLIAATLRNSACYDEPAHLAAGAAYWHEGEHGIYDLSPPLLRYWAAAPAYFAGADAPPARRDRDILAARRHWVYTDAFEDANAGRTPRYVLWGRWMMLPFSLATAGVIFLWSCELYGQAAGLLSCAMWCFSPLVLAQASVIGTDIGCCCAMVWTAYLWTHFLHDAKPIRALSPALALTVGLVSKFTALLCWPMITLIGVHQWLRRRTQIKDVLTGLLLCGVISFVGFNAMYRFKLMGDALGSFHFYSSTMLRVQHWLPAKLPLPFNRQAIEGFDSQKFESEHVYSAVLLGEGYFGGDWRFYPLQLAMCETVGGLLLGFSTIISLFWRRPTREEWPVMIAFVVMLASLLEVAEINISLRYILPTYPFLAVLIGRLLCLFPSPPYAGEGVRARGSSTEEHTDIEEFPGKAPPHPNPLPRSTGGEGTRRKYLVGMIALAMVAESIAAAPWFHSFTNLAFRFTSLRPTATECDWGQSLILVRQWQDAHPGQRCALFYFGTARPSDYGIQQVGNEHADTADVLIVSKVMVYGKPESVNAKYVLLRCWRELAAQKPIADLDGMWVYSMDQVRQTGVTPWFKIIHSWWEAWQDPKCIHFRNRPNEPL